MYFFTQQHTPIGLDARWLVANTRLFQMKKNDTAFRAHTAFTSNHNVSLLAARSFLHLHVDMRNATGKVYNTVKEVDQENQINTNSHLFRVCAACYSRTHQAVQWWGKKAIVASRGNKKKTETKHERPEKHKKRTKLVVHTRIAKQCR